LILKVIPDTLFLPVWANGFACCARAVAQAAQVSERHLANLEAASGNASILILLQVAQALNCSVFELLGKVTTSSPEWLLIRKSAAWRAQRSAAAAYKNQHCRHVCGPWRRSGKISPYCLGGFARRWQVNLLKSSGGQLQLDFCRVKP
jgi:transcriptional regulator with XRE-family HTH domain